MLGGYPNRSQAGDTYIGTMAKILMNYPRAIAARCADPLRGVAVTTKFLPTAADITEWCDRQTLPLAKSAERDDRLREQFNARDDWKGAGPSQALLEKTRAWLDRTDPAAAELVGKNDLAAKERQEAAAARTLANKKEFFERECRAEGIDPSRGVSPALLKTLGVK